MNFLNSSKTVLALLGVLALTSCAMKTQETSWDNENFMGKTFEVSISSENSSNLLTLLGELKAVLRSAVQLDELQKLLSLTGSNEVSSDPSPNLIPSPKPSEPNESIEVVETKLTIENGTFRGFTNPDRPTWYFKKRLSDYPNSFQVTACGETFVAETNGARFTRGSFLLKQSDVKNRGMALLGPGGKKCLDKNASIKY